MSEILNKFEICSKIDVNLKNNIKLFHVFKDTNGCQSVIFVTNDDRVYWIRSESKQKIQFTHMFHRFPQVVSLSSCSSVNIWVLNRKTIEKFVIDENYIVAINNENELFIWDIMLGQDIDEMSPKKINTPRIQIKQVSFGLDHGHILFEDGQVYQFNYSMSSNMREANANKINFSSNYPVGSIPIKILYLVNSWVALLDNGKVCRWKTNHNDYDDYYSIPSTVSINILQTEFNVIDICNISEKLLLLSDDSRIQCCYIHNSRFETSDFVNTNSTINKSIIGLSSYDQDVIAESDCCVYSLRKISGSPLKSLSWNTTDYINKFEYFEKLHQITYETVVLEENAANSSKMSLSGNKSKNLMEKAFDNKEFYDLKFKLQKKSSKGKSDYIYVHKWVIKQNSQYFDRMFANEWKESVSNEIQINGYSYEAYYQYLRWLYTDLIDSSDVEVLIEMLSLSDEYLENQLKVICEERIKKSANIQNICVLYSKAIELNAKELEKFSFNLIRKNIKRVIEMNEFKAMDNTIAKDMLVQYIRQQ